MGTFLSILTAIYVLQETNVFYYFGKVLAETRFVRLAPDKTLNKIEAVKFKKKKIINIKSKL